tara:strand:+ start:470 stop:946 length:477 start_codon:yes stop_codon:yes gene_type:complete
MKTLLTVLLLTVSSLALAERSTIINGNILTQSEWIAGMPRLAHNYNKTLPSVLDDITVLESLHADGILNVMHYNYTLDFKKLSVMAHGSVQAMSKDKMDEVKTELRSILTDKYCSSDDLSSWRDLGTMIFHTYYSIKGNQTVYILVSPDLDCPLKGNL